jgi:hypothetical protein
MDTERTMTESTPRRRRGTRTAVAATALLAGALALAPVSPASASSFNCSSTITNVNVGSYEDGRQFTATVNYHCPDMIVGDYVDLSGSVKINGADAPLLAVGGQTFITPNLTTRQCVLPRDLGTGTHDLNCTLYITANAPAGTNTYDVVTSDLLTGIHTDPYEPLNSSGSYVR